MQKTQIYIDGGWRDAADGRRFDVLDPASEDVLASVSAAGIAEADAALDAAQAAFAGWAGRAPRERAEVLRRAYELMTDRLDDFTRTIVLENGKASGDARSEAAYAAEFFRWFAEEAVRVQGTVTRAPAGGGRIYVHHRPAGIAVMVTPWNFPAAMGTRKIAPALAAGCPVILKPSEDTPLTMLMLAELLEEAGVPPGIVNILPTDSAKPLVEHLLADPRVRVVSFTGSTAVGKELLKTAADGVLTPAMELGGNAPFLVFEDADIDAAVEGAMLAKMRNMGEACTAANRFYVHEAVQARFTEAFTEKMAGLSMGSGLQDGVKVGPLINPKTRDKVAGFVQDALAKGAACRLGGTLPEGKGYFYPPTVLTDIPPDADLIRGEIFGPVAAIQTFTDEAEVIARANDTVYGLVAYVFTRDLRRGLRVAEALDYGMVGLNRGLVSDAAAPFGGTKQSGLGREGGHAGIHEYLEMQYIAAEW